LPDQVAIENDFPSSIQNALSNMGYSFQKRNQIGRTEVIKINWEGKKIKNIEAVADKRGDDHAAAY
jgi:gamma-glutamyltranspeptidase/glutathione hydrolase